MPFSFKQNQRKQLKSR